MVIAGKKINFLGDSITEGAGVSCQENIYLNVMKKQYNLSCARNYGISGTRFAKQLNSSAEVSFDNDFILRAEKMENDAKYSILPNCELREKMWRKSWKLMEKINYYLYDASGMYRKDKKHLLTNSGCLNIDLLNTDRTNKNE